MLRVGYMNCVSGITLDAKINYCGETSNVYFHLLCMLSLSMVLPLVALCGLGKLLDIKTCSILTTKILILKM